MTLEELRSKIEMILPDAAIEKDNQSQLVIYTGLALNPDGNELDIFGEFDVNEPTIL